MKKKVLLVGEHPLLNTGCGLMMKGVIDQIDRETYQFYCLARGSDRINPFPSVYEPLDYTILPSESDGGIWGEGKLIALLHKEVDLHALVMVGIDVWRYAAVYAAILQIQRVVGFKWVWLLPYDLQHVRGDWVDLIKCISHPCVYSQYGYDALKPFVPQIEYFRPHMPNPDIYKVPSKEEKTELRNKWFPRISDKDFLFGFVGVNQIRKDPQRVIGAFKILRQEHPNARLYLHTEIEGGAFNLKRYAKDCGIEQGDIFTKPMRHISAEEMVELYSCLDSLVNSSVQEGLSWTLIEAMACGVPVIATDTTAQTELIEDTGISVPCEQTMFFPTMANTGEGWGPSFVDANCCSTTMMYLAMKQMIEDRRTREVCQTQGIIKAADYFDSVSDINEVLGRVEEKPAVPEKIDKILFAQHSSAGDVLMSTQCFKGIRERHPGKKFVYMTQGVFQDIVRDNPYIDEIVEWDPELLSAHSIVYNPHGEKILPGGWNNLDVKLYDMYPYFCKVEADAMFIELVTPKVDLPDSPYIVVHTTGGSAEYRTYKYMDFAINNLEVPVVQVGGISDLGCSNADYDLRGRLSWRETAYVMKHAQAAVVIDSFPAHLAGALGTPVVVLFGPAPARVTAPKADSNRLVCMEPDMLAVCNELHHCWSNPVQMKQKCISPCINTINPAEVRKSLLRMMEVGK